MRRELAQLRSDSEDAMNHAGFALSYSAMAVCGLVIVLGLVAGALWKKLARRQTVRSIVRDPRRRASEATTVAKIREAGL